MAYSYQLQPNTNLNRTSWGPCSIPPQLEMPGKLYDRPISGNFDRLINAFERTNAFHYVRSNFEQPKKPKIKENVERCVRFENSKNDEKTRNAAIEASKIINDSLKLVKVEKELSKPVDIERIKGHGDIVTNRKTDAICSSYERADGNLASRQTPCSDEDVAEYYQERLLYSQARQLFPLQEDLADWINKTIGISYLTGDNFLDILDNGVELCELAAVIRDKAKDAVQRGRTTGPVPTIKGRCWKKAARRSFFSRDNMENFITFCRELGVHENLLFESDDLVMHAQPRNVVLCLLEVARLATKYDVEPPGLVQLEREIAMEEHDSGMDSAMSGLLAWQFRESSPLQDGKSDDDSSREKTNPPPSPTGILETVRDSSPADDGISAGSGEDPEIAAAAQVKPLSELDKRVQLATRLMQRKCNCSSGKCSKLLKVKKVGEGRYNIAGRNVFIRLLKGRHMMVRVGGGWDTLEHFLSRHDPCQVRLITPSAQTPTSPTTHTITTVDLSTLNIAYSSAEEDRKSNTSVSLSETSSDGKKTPPTRKPAANPQLRRQSLTLPLKNTAEPAKPTRAKTAEAKAKRNSMHNLPKNPISNTLTKKSRSMSLTPISPASNKNLKSPDPPKFCGTDKLNAMVKKSRSTSLTSSAFITPNTKKSRSTSLSSPSGLSPTGSVRSIKSPTTPKWSLSQSMIETPLSSSTPTKPAFLHIKAKYRSPPPREVPPR